MRDLKYKATQLKQHSIITLNNVKCSDRHIKMKNEFSWLSEAEQVCAELNKPKFVTVIADVNKLEIKK